MTIKEGYTRVSEILSPWTDFSNINPEVLANKCRIGTNVHQRISCDEEGIFVELAEDETGYYESWLKWKEKNSPKILHSELRLYCETFKITGCVDAIAEVEDRIILLDFKTSAAPHKLSWAIQGALYHYLCISNGYFVSDKFTFLQLKKDGNIGKEREFTITSGLMESCFAAIKIYRYFKG